MGKKTFTLEGVIKSLSRKHDFRIVDGIIYILVGKAAHNDLGNGSWGKIDYLVKQHNYILTKVEKLPGGYRNK